MADERVEGEAERTLQQCCFSAARVREQRDELDQRVGLDLLGPVVERHRVEHAGDAQVHVGVG